MNTNQKVVIMVLFNPTIIGKIKGYIHHKRIIAITLNLIKLLLRKGKKLMTKMNQIQILEWQRIQFLESSHRLFMEIQELIPERVTETFTIIVL